MRTAPQRQNQAAQRDDTRWIVVDRTDAVHARVTAAGRTAAERFAWAIFPELAEDGGRVLGWFDASNVQRATAKPAFHITRDLYAKQQQGQIFAASGRTGGAR
jgi:hypothetical protein